MFGFGMDLLGPRMPFNREYHCFSVSMMPGHERHDVENGGKIILPPSALEHLTRLNTAYPMLFKLTNSRKNRTTHSGVLEFVADEGRCYIPHWMMSNLLLEEGNPVRIQSVSLPVANFSKFEPQSSQFLDISNPKAVLENALRNFACLTSGDMIAIRYNDRIYELRVLETKPGPAVSIIECDMDVDFAPPTDYVEPIRRNPDAMDTAEPEDDIVAEGQRQQFLAFAGSGNRLDGKAAESLNQGVTRGAGVRGIPDYDYQVGTIQFFRRKIPPSNSKKNSADENGFKAFEGKGEALRPPPPPPPQNPGPSPPPRPPHTTRSQHQTRNQFFPNLSDLNFQAGRVALTTYPANLPRVLPNLIQSSAESENAPIPLPPPPPHAPPLRTTNTVTFQFTPTPPSSSPLTLTPYPGLSMSDFENQEATETPDGPQSSVPPSTRIQTPASFYEEYGRYGYEVGYYDSLAGPANTSLALVESSAEDDPLDEDALDDDMEL